MRAERTAPPRTSVRKSEYTTSRGGARSGPPAPRRAPAAAASATPNSSASAATRLGPEQTFGANPHPQPRAERAGAASAC